MFKDKKVVVVMPAYNAAQTLCDTYDEVMAQEIVDLVIVVDDASSDQTATIAAGLPNTIVHTHPSNLGYGANQKTCYSLALQHDADIIIMVHPDYQYTPKLIPAMASLIGNDLYPCVLGSRILGGYALKGKMPLWRAFSRRLLEQLPLQANSDDFVFDNQMLTQILWYGHTIAEVSCPTRYFPEASSINFWGSLKYGFGCLWTAIRFRLAKWNLIKSRLFPRADKSRSPSPESSQIDG
jgi:glycosyltransferase involved in cell wall biosynthesis